ncbi:uncharacterized protein [Halyomorpha halys]|uniref:uncharacterized protein isoform X2 n=1 Tax=Halyomorpha halys TaxID=286706 RepID=UPI0006D51E59|nr:uncharacterized protein LOC106683057 isoform X2 [Halyomorpha halys]
MSQKNQDDQKDTSTRGSRRSYETPRDRKSRRSDSTRRRLNMSSVYIDKTTVDKGHITVPRFYRSHSPICQPYRTYAGTTQLLCQKPQNIPNDSLNTEFIFYMGAIKELLPAMSVYGDRLKVLPWLKKLAAPEYQASRLRTKRNKYLLHLTLILMTDTIFGIFLEPPSLGKLLDISLLKTPENLPLARWEKEAYWDELLKELRAEDSVMRCCCHECCGENEQDGNVHPIAGALLDQEFKFFLYLAKPIVSLISDIRDKGICAVWILTLAKVRTCSCLTMKAIRNDYMQALLGYIQDLRMVRPFNKLPPENGETLRPLAEIAENKTGMGFLTQPMSTYTVFHLSRDTN